MKGEPGPVLESVSDLGPDAAGQAGSAERKRPFAFIFAQNLRHCFWYETGKDYQVMHVRKDSRPWRWSLCTWLRKHASGLAFPGISRK